MLWVSYISYHIIKEKRWLLNATGGNKESVIFGVYCLLFARLTDIASFQELSSKQYHDITLLFQAVQLLVGIKVSIFISYAHSFFVFQG